MNNTSYCRLSTVQVSRAPKWLVGAMSDCASLGRVWAWEVRPTLGTWWASQALEGTDA